MSRGEERSVEKLGCNLRAVVDVDDQHETKADDGGRVRLETCKSSAGLIRRWSADIRSVPVDGTVDCRCILQDCTRYRTTRNSKVANQGENFCQYWYCRSRSAVLRATVPSVPTQRLRRNSQFEIQISSCSNDQNHRGITTCPTLHATHCVFVPWILAVHV